MADKKAARPYGLVFLILTAGILVAAFVRHNLFDAKDAHRCDATMAAGQWLDSPASGRAKTYSRWQPDSCMLRTYNAKAITKCLGSPQGETLFVGDSTVRNIFWATARQLDSKKAIETSARTEKHQDITFTAAGTTLNFVWDPFLNSSYLNQYLGPSHSNTKTAALAAGKSMLVVGAGLWFAQHEAKSVEAYKTAIDRITDPLPVAQPESLGGHRPLVVPVLPPFYEALDAGHKELRPDKVDQMNAYLQDVKTNHDADILTSFLAMIENEPSAAYESTGIHSIPRIADQQAQIILNMKCNQKEDTYMFNGTCCYSYPFDLAATLLFIIEAILLLAVAWIELQNYTGVKSEGLAKRAQDNLALIRPLLVMLAGLTYCYICDRTQLFGKIHKLYNAQDFWVMILAIVVAGAATVKRSASPTRPGQEKAAPVDQPFLSRDQTDEWKGWMQVIILAYHYTGASKVLPIYKFVRLLVASYLFMTGYGHTAYFYQKNDFSLKRVVAVNFRINLLSMLLPWMMKTDYLFYYFAPLVTYWYAVIYLTMRVKSDWNQNLPWFLGKLAVACALTTFLHTQEWLLHPIFVIINSVFGSKWEAREWLFRVSLDQFIVYIGMIVSVLYIRSTKPPAPPAPPQGSMATTSHTRSGASVNLHKAAQFAVSGAMLVAYVVLQSYGTSKTSSNKIHTYISPLPILAFIHLRNCTATLRNHYSTAYAWVGKISLETFVLQYHLWLAGDTQGLLNLGWFGHGSMASGAGVFGAGMGLGRWIDCLLLGTAFVWVSYKVANATGGVTAAVVKIFF